jgi:hypothetical protein
LITFSFSQCRNSGVMSCSTFHTTYSSSQNSQKSQHFATKKLCNIFVVIVAVVLCHSINASYRKKKTIGTSGFEEVRKDKSKSVSWMWPFSRSKMFSGLRSL